MAAVKARRSGRARGRSAPSPQSTPKLAYMKLEGARRVAESFEGLKSPRKMGLAFASMVLMTGVAVAGAVWIGGSLFDAREALASSGDALAARAGFAIQRPIAVSGVSGARAEEVRAIAVPLDRQSLFAADPAAVRQRVEKLDWVEKAEVRRLWPSTVRISVTRRQAFALWRREEGATVVDAAGKPLANSKWIDFAGLPVIQGGDAGPAAQPILAALENAPAVRARLKAARRVGERRWDLQLKSGAIVSLPEDRPSAALAAVSLLQARHQILDRPLARIDMRTPGRVIVAPRDLAGA
ncbi:MAG: cell division protein FtsQ/DivIB [Hyphomonadaceae bacterium]